MMGDLHYDWSAEDTWDCDHEDYELDILTGRATCTMCNHRWFMSDEELARDQKRRMMEYPE